MTLRAAVCLIPASLLVMSALAVVGCVSEDGAKPRVSASPAVGRADAANRVEIATFNIRYATLSDGPDAWPNRRREVCELLAAGDIWGLQEVLPEQLDDILRACPSKAHIARTREVDPTKGESCAILFESARWECDPLEYGTFWLSETPSIAGSKSWDSSIARIATYARLMERNAADDASPRRALSIYNVHLDHRGSRAREEQVKVVLAHIAARRHADEPVVLVGDFNTGPDSAPIATVLSATPVFIDAWRAANPDAPEQGTFNGWNDSCGTSRIDFIFVHGLEVVRTFIDLTRRANGRWPSDHVPVRAVVGLPKTLGL